MPTYESTEQTLYYHCKPQNIYEALTNDKLISSYTQSPAQVDAREGGTFSFFAGSIHGTFVKLEPPNHITMKWRMKQWTEGEYSDVDISITEVRDSVTRVQLKQTHIPHDDRVSC